MNDLNPIQLFDLIIAQIALLKGPKLLMVFTILLGYVLKAIKPLPNRWIPVVLFVVGTSLAPFLVAWPQPGDMDPNLKFPEVAAWLQVLIAGALLVASSWLLHARLLKQFIDDKIVRRHQGAMPNQPTP